MKNDVKAVIVMILFNENIVEERAAHTRSEEKMAKKKKVLYQWRILSAINMKIYQISNTM